MTVYTTMMAMQIVALVQDHKHYKALCVYQSVASLPVIDKAMLDNHIITYLEK